MTEVKCCICGLPITDKEDLEWAQSEENHPGILGPCHQICYMKAGEMEPDLPWEDPISGEIDYRAMAEDLGVSDPEWEEEEDWY